MRQSPFGFGPRFEARGLLAHTILCSTAGFALVGRPARLGLEQGIFGIMS